MNTDNFHTTALERAVTALLSNDDATLKNICDTVNQTAFNLCLVETALSSCVECLAIVVEPLNGLYDASADCLKSLTPDNVDEERFKVLLPLSDPATIHPTTQTTLWSLALLLNLPTEFYINWKTDSKTVANALPALKDCANIELIQWCVEKSCALNYIEGWANPAWKAAQDAKNFAFLNVLASHLNPENRWVDQVNKNWSVWEEHVCELTPYPQLSALALSVAIQKNSWKVVQQLIPYARRSALVTDTSVATKNIFICNWVFSNGFVLSPKNLWQMINEPDDRPLDEKGLVFFKDLLSCDRKWNMGVWNGLKKECGTTELFCQLLMHSEEAADILRSEIDINFGNGLPLRLAAMLGREQTVVEALPHCDPKAHNSKALALAALNGHHKTVELLLPHSEPTANSCLALSCALWFDSQNNTDLCCSLLITSDTAPEKMAQMWRQNIEQHSGETRYVNLFKHFNEPTDKDCSVFGRLTRRDHAVHGSVIFMEHIDDLDDQLLDDPLHDNDRDSTIVYGNTAFEISKKYPMSWSNFDQPIEYWWSSLTKAYLMKINQHLSHVFPNALKQHLCDANENHERQKRRI